MLDQRPVLVGLNIGLMVLTLGAICSRLGRRVIVLGTWRYHDLIIAAAAICAFVFSIFLCIGTRYGLGLHSPQLNEGDLPKLMKLMRIFNVFYFACNWFVKHSLLVFYSELVCETKHQISIYIMHFIAFGFGLSSILVTLFQCTPVAKAYMPTLSGHCVDIGAFFVANSCIMMSNDLVLYIMPLMFTRKLQLQRPQRIGVNFLFGLGGFVLVASAVRIYACHLFVTRPDFPWRFATIMICSAVENHLAIIVACAPSIKVIAQLIFPRLVSSYRKFFSRGSSWSQSRESEDLESGPRRNDKLRPPRSNTPGSSPMLTVGSRWSEGLRQYFKAPNSSRRLASTDSMDLGIVFVDDVTESAEEDIHLRSVPSECGKTLDGGKIGDFAGHLKDFDIRVEHTIEVQSSRGSRDDEISVVGQAPQT